MRIVTFLFLAGILLITSFALSEASPIVGAPDQRFGLTESFWLTEEAYQLRVGWERILFYWSEIQPDGPEEWNTLHVREEWIAQANSQGRMVVGLIKNTPDWASADGSPAGVPLGLWLPYDDPGNTWAQFVSKVAEYYGPRNVHHWIIWNEPDIRRGVYGFEFSGTMTEYYQMLKIAYRVMKDADPNATIHLAGLTWWHDETYLPRLVELIANDPDSSENDFFFDVFTLHIYFRTESIREIISSVQKLQRQYKLDKPIWINETNAPPNQDPDWPVQRPVFNVDPVQQAWFIIQSFSLAFAQGAESVSVYKLVDINIQEGDESFGLVRPDSSRRPAFVAYKVVANYLHGFKDVALSEYPEYYAISFFRPTGVTQIAWARSDDEMKVEVPAFVGQGYLIDATGKTLPIIAENGYYKIELDGAECDEECIIGGPPLFVVESF